MPALFVFVSITCVNYRLPPFVEESKVQVFLQIKRKAGLPINLASSLNP
jgi:hypothetical protein